MLTLGRHGQMGGRGVVLPGTKADPPPAATGRSMPPSASNSVRPLRRIRPLAGRSRPARQRSNWPCPPPKPPAPQGRRQWLAKGDPQGKAPKGRSTAATSSWKGALGAGPSATVWTRRFPRSLPQRLSPEISQGSVYPAPACGWQQGPQARFQQATGCRRLSSSTQGPSSRQAPADIAASQQQKSPTGRVWVRPGMCPHAHRWCELPQRRAKLRLYLRPTRRRQPPAAARIRHSTWLSSAPSCGPLWQGWDRSARKAAMCLPGTSAESHHGRAEHRAGPAEHERNPQRSRQHLRSARPPSMFAHKTKPQQPWDGQHQLAASRNKIGQVRRKPRQRCPARPPAPAAERQQNRRAWRCAGESPDGGWKVSPGERTASGSGPRSVGIKALAAGNAAWQQPY